MYQNGRLSMQKKKMFLFILHPHPSYISTCTALAWLPPRKTLDFCSREAKRSRCCQDFELAWRSPQPSHSPAIRSRSPSLPPRGSPASTSPSTTPPPPAPFPFSDSLPGQYQSRSVSQTLVLIRLVIKFGAFD